MATKPGVLVLCTGNSCRSKIAEAYLKEMAGDRFTVYSAGTEPASEVHPLARQVLLEDGIDLGDSKPRDYRDFLGKISVYYLIIVCDGAARSCPSVWPGVIERLQWPFEDPAAYCGTPEATMQKFREVRDQIKSRIAEWVSTIDDGTSTDRRIEAS